MARVKQERMTKNSRLRRIAKRALPKRLNANRRAAHAAAIEAKQPREPRLVQREKRLAAKAAEKERMAVARKSLAARLGLAAA